MVKTIRNTPLLDKLEKEIKYLQNYGVIVGIFGKNATKTQNGVTIGYYANCLNEGTLTIEKKPFFYETTGNKESKIIINNKKKELLKQVYAGEITGKQCLMQLGIFVSQRIKNKIMNNNYKNSPERIKQKKRNKYNTLRENDFMLNAVSFEIIKMK